MHKAKLIFDVLIKVTKKVSKSLVYQISTSVVPFEQKCVSFIHSEILIMEKFHFRLL